MTKDEALHLALEALEDLGMKHYENTGEVLCKETFTAIKAALEAKDEPVAYLQPTASPENACYNPPQRKPLTDEEILTYRYMIDWTAEWSYINFARAIEAAHGIKGKA